LFLLANSRILSCCGSLLNFDLLLFGEHAQYLLIVQPCRSQYGDVDQAAIPLILIHNPGKSLYDFTTRRMAIWASSIHAMPLSESATSFPILSASGRPVCQPAIARLFFDHDFGIGKVANIVSAMGQHIGRAPCIFAWHISFKAAMYRAWRLGVYRLPLFDPARAQATTSPGTTNS
jgi:hypothetical protein